MSISKRVTYISPNMVDATADTIRKSINAFWSTRDRSAKRKKAMQLTYLGKDKKVPKFGRISDFALTEEVDVDKTTLPTKTLSMRIYGRESEFANQTDWANYVQTIYSSGPFEDHTFSVEQPLSVREAEELGGGTRTKTYDLNLEYNYYQEVYERMQQAIGTEKNLPNLYALYSIKEEDEMTARNNIFQAHVSLGGLLDRNQSNQFTDKASENPRAANSAEYLKTWSRAAIRNRLGGPGMVAVRNAYTNVMLSPSSTSILSYNNKRFMFPMFGEITFATDKTTQFTQILQDSELSAVFMKDLYGSSLNATGWRHVEKDFTSQVAMPVQEQTNRGTNRIRYVNTIEPAKAKMWNVQEWFSYFQSNPPSRMTTGVFLGQENREIRMAEASNYGFYKKMIETIFMGKLRTLVKSQQRRFADILDGDNCYSEELFYKIEKLSARNEEVIQTFWLANTNEIDVYNFIDTQVKYAQEYTYRATVFSLVLGARYQYSNLATSRRVTQECIELIQNGNPVAPRVPSHVEVNRVAGTRTAIITPRDQRFIAEFDVTVTPHVFVAETPFFERRGRLIDDPPLAPEIDILPYRTDSRFLKFFMQASSGEKTMMPVIITETDKVMVSEIRKAKRILLDEPITYASDDPASLYQIYRMTEPPKKYEDFKNHLRKQVSTDISSETPQKASSIAYVDQIRPNQKYYYMFRAVDVHNMVGEPTPVYEVEMVNDKGAFYPTVRIHDMKEKKDITYTKSGRRFIQIIPNIEQTLLNEEKSGFDDYNSAKDITGKMTYGYSEESIWNKKFKIRLTSTKTGKKIDVNLRFKTKKVKTDFEESS
jgi:hypothetical protein